MDMVQRCVLQTNQLESQALECRKRHRRLPHRVNIAVSVSMHLTYSCSIFNMLMPFAITSTLWSALPMPSCRSVSRKQHQHIL